MVTPPRSPFAGALAISLVLMGLNVSVWALQIASGLSPTSPTPDQLMAWGGNLAPLTLNGEAWRLFTSTFLHGGIVHLAANMYMLFIVTPHAVRRYGRVGMLLVYVAGGLLASLASAAWTGAHLLQTVPATNPYGIAPGAREVVNLTVGVGASGAIMALCGALAAVWLTSLFARGPIHDDDAQFHKALLQTIAINVALGFAIPGIDQAAHLGGLVGGLVLGGVIGTAQPAAPTSMRWVRMVTAAVLAAVAIGAGLQAANNPDARDVAEQMRAEAGEGGADR